MKPRRSVLYMPGANARALDKARTLPCDVVILDLEDAVAADAKDAARAQVVTTVTDGGYGHREIVVRINGLDTPWGAADLAAIGHVAGRIDGMLVPKVESAAQVIALRDALVQVGAGQLPLWLMIETPRAVLACEQIALADNNLGALVLGTTDLVTALRARHTTGRQEVLAALAHCVLVARATDHCVLDGVHLDFRNLDSFRAACVQGRDLGFDGKTLIHPDQIAIANDVFGFDSDAINHAQRVIALWQEASAAGKGVAVLDGKLIEALHVREAERALAFAAALNDRDGR